MLRKEWRRWVTSCRGALYGYNRSTGPKAMTEKDAALCRAVIAVDARLNDLEHIILASIKRLEEDIKDRPDGTQAHWALKNLRFVYKKGGGDNV